MFAKFFAPRADQAYAVLRIATGSMFSFHGMQKILGIFAAETPASGSQIWFGGVIELIAGLAIAAGLFTRCVAFVASVTMAVAYVQFHWRFAFGKEFFPAINKGELAVVYAFVFFYFACRGAGRYSVDALRGAPCAADEDERSP